MITALLVDDDLTQLKLSALRLRDEGYSVLTASSGEQALATVRSLHPDVIVSDVLMDGLDGFALCRHLRANPELARIPIILLSAHYQGEPDQSLAHRVGASALVSRTPDFAAELAALREHLAKVPPAALPPDAALYEEHLRSNAHQMGRLLDRARFAEEQYRSLFDHAHDPIAVLTPEGIILAANERWRPLLGIEPSSMIGKHFSEFSTPGEQEIDSASFERATQVSTTTSRATPVRSTTGETRYFEFSTSLVDLGGAPTVFAIGHDVTELLQAARQQAAAEARYRSLVERIPDVIWTCRVDGALTFITPNVASVFGFTMQEVLAETFEQRLNRCHPQDSAAVAEGFAEYVRADVPLDVQYRRRHKDGTWIWLHLRSIGSYEVDGVRYIEGMITNITERKRLEDKLRQAQKMEAIGQLTGGIAHDFNNILSVILSNAHFLSEDIAQQDPRQRDVEEIVAAGERAAALTRQLLAFSRHQVVDTKVVDLNTVVGGIDKMLRRLIGEDVTFTVMLGNDVGAVLADIGQLEQVIMNLAVNARDAMPMGGELTIETDSVEVKKRPSTSPLGDGPSFPSAIQAAGWMRRPRRECSIRSSRPRAPVKGRDSGSRPATAS